jgi:4,5-dihydroxyphthalate decarboxylase
MAGLKLTAGFWDYDRTRALMDGSVVPEGVAEIKHVNLFPSATFQRMISRNEFEFSEMGLTFYLGTIQRDNPFIAIPVFPVRLFVHSAISVNANSGIASPEDLVGRKIGELFFFGHDTGTWIKGILSDEYGVRADSVSYYVGGIDSYSPKWDWVPLSPSKNIAVHQLGQGQTLDAMLRTGEIAALYSAISPPSLIAQSNVRYLFADPEAAGRDYFKRTGIFPIMHTVAIRRDVYQNHRWLARSLYDAFKAAKEKALALPSRRSEPANLVVNSVARSAG